VNCHVKSGSRHASLYRGLDNLRRILVVPRGRAPQNKFFVIHAQTGLNCAPSRSASLTVSLPGGVGTLAPPRQERYIIEQGFSEMCPSESQLRIMIDTIPALPWSCLPDGANEFTSKRWESTLSEVEATRFVFAVLLRNRSRSRRWRLPQSSRVAESAVLIRLANSAGAPGR